MQLVNTSPAVAHLSVSELEGVPFRIGMLTAKLTYRFDPSGRLVLEREDPDPLRLMDVPTEAGLLPQDLVMRRSPKLEVFVLGAACAPRGRAVERMTVEVRIGAQVRRLFVFGDREWIGEGEHATISRPEPFTRMPLTWERAFGGTTELWLDSQNSLPMSDPWNPLGKGYHPLEWTRYQADDLGAAPGFPQLSSARRMLPNLEDPSSLIAKWTDSPEPLCWGPIPMQVPYRSRPLVTRMKTEPPPQGIEPAEHLLSLLAPERAIEWDEHFWRAHHTMILDPVAAGAPIVLRGVHPDVDAIRLELPAERIEADFVVGGNVGARTLTPQSLLLDAERMRITVTARTSFRVDAAREQERSFRLRVEGTPRARITEAA